MSTTDTSNGDRIEVDPRHMAAWLRRMADCDDEPPTEEKARRLAWVAGPVKSESLALSYGL